MKSFQLFKGLSLLILLNLLVKPVWIFFIDRQVQNTVGFEEYGKYFAVLNLSYVLFFLADAGLSNMIAQRLARNTEVSGPQLLGVKTFLLFLYSSICFFVAWIAGLERWDILIYVVLIQALTSFFIFLRSMVMAHQYFVTDAWFSVIDKLLMILLCGGLIYTSFFGTISMILFLQIQMSCILFSVIAALLFVITNKLIPVGPGERIVVIIKRIVPFAVIIFLMSLHYRFDGFLLERIHPDGALEAGIYASAYRLLDAGNMAGYLAASFIVPFISRHQTNSLLIKKIVVAARHGLLLVAIAVTSFSIVFAPWIQQILYHSNASYNTRIIQLCIAALPAYYLVHVYGSALTATSLFKTFITVLLLAVGTNCVLNLVLIPSYGAIGCCISALVSQYLCGVLLVMESKKVLSVSIDAKSILIYILLAILLLLVFYGSKILSINVWIVLLTSVCITFLLLIIRLGRIKKYFASLR